METKRKVCFVITTRIHYSRNKLVLEALRNHPEIELQVVVGGAAVLEKVGLVEPELIADGFRVDGRFHMAFEGTSPVTMAKSAGVGLLEISGLFERLEPDVVLVRGDRYEMLPVAIAAAYMNIPVAHIEGGDVTGTIDESVRHAITKLSHIHFPTNDDSARRIKEMGEDPNYVFTVGSPELEVVSLNNFSVSPEFINRLGVGDVIDPTKPFIMVMQHPVTTESEEARAQITETLHAVNECGIPALWFWPNIDAGSDLLSKGIRAFRENEKPEHIRFIKHLPAEQFYGLLRQTACLVGNSSAGFKETGFFGIPVVNIGSRQHNRYGVERGKHIKDAGYDRREIKAAIEGQVAHGRYPSDTYLYRKDTAKQIADTLATIPLYVQKTFFERS